MLSYKKFLNEKVADIIGNMITLDDKPDIGFSDELSYQILFEYTKKGYEISDDLRDMIDIGINEIQQQYKKVTFRKFGNYTNATVNDNYQLIKKKLRPVFQKLDKVAPEEIDKGVSWAVIMTNNILHTFLMNMFNYIQFSNKKIDINKYLDFLVNYQDDIYFPGGILHDEVLSILQGTMKKGKEAEDAASVFLKALGNGGYWIDDWRKARINFLPLIKPGDVVEPTRHEDNKGIDLFKKMKHKYSTKSYTIQVKTLDYARGNKISGLGKIDDYNVDFYIFVKIKDPKVFYIIRNLGVKVNDRTLTVPQANLLIIGDYNRKGV